jgi:hypothetical protein
MGDKFDRDSFYPNRADTEEETKEYIRSGKKRPFVYEEFKTGYDEGDNEHSYSPEVITRATELAEANREKESARKEADKLRRVEADRKAIEDAKRKIKEEDEYTALNRYAGNERRNKALERQQSYINQAELKKQAQKEAEDQAEIESEIKAKVRTQPVGETIPEGEFDPDERERDASYYRGKSARYSKKAAEIEFERKYPDAKYAKDRWNLLKNDVLNENPKIKKTVDFFKNTYSLGSAGKEKLYDPVRDYIGEKIEDISDNRKADLGAGAGNINKFRKLQDDLDKLDPDDKASAKKIKREMQDISLIMRDNIAKRRKEKRKEEKDRLMDNLTIERMSIANEKAATAAYNKKDPAIRPTQPKEWKQRANVKLGGTKMLGGINLGGTSSGGLNLAPVRANMPKFVGLGPAPQPTPKQSLQAVREMHARKEYEKEYARQVAIAQRRQYEREMEGAVVNQRRVEQARGQLPPAQMGMQLAQRQGIGGNFRANIRMPDVVLPNFNGFHNSSTKPHIRVPLATNTKSVQKPIGNKIQNKSTVVSSASRIRAGIENMVAPVRAQAHQHRAKVFGGESCKMCDVAVNTKNIGIAHHQGRKFGLDIAPIKLNMDVATHKKKKKGGK